MQLQVGWAHGPTLRPGVAQRPLLGHGPNLQFTTKSLNLMAVTLALSRLREGGDFILNFKSYDARIIALPPHQSYVNHSRSKLATIYQCV